MDYESRKVKWYWLILFLIYCGTVSYLLFLGNPYLYSHLDLRAALSNNDQMRFQIIPAHPAAIKPGAPTFRARYNLQRTGLDPETVTRSKNLIEYQHFAIDSGIPNWNVEHVSSDDTGFYLTGKKPWVVAVDLSGNVRWKFHFQNVPEDRSLLPVLLDQTSAYMIQPGGEIVCVDKISGEIRWVRQLNAEIVANPILYNADVLVPVSGDSTVDLILVQRADGALEKTRPELDIKPGFHLSASNDEHILYATVENKVLAINPQNSWQIDWTQTLTDPIRGPAVVVNNEIFVTTLGAKVDKLAANRHGHVDWEVDLPRPAAGPPSFLPISNRLSVIDVQGVLNAIDARSGKLIWHYNIDDRNPLKQTWSARLMGHFIEEFKMDWLHKGWTIWSPCSKNRFCIYRDDKGQLINRVPLSAAPLALPLIVGRRFYFVGRQAPGKYVVSQVLEDTEVKKLDRVQKKKDPPQATTNP